MGSPRYRVPSELRAAVARLMRESDLTMAAIAVTTGVSLGTIGKWNRAEGWRPIQAMRRDWDASPPRLIALGRLARVRPRPEPAPRRGAASAGAAAQDTQAYEAADIQALPTDLSSLPTDLPSLPSDLPALRAALRDHIGRQIAAFDAALRGEGAAVIDSARVLRDLGGLKRLLDDLGGEGGDDASGLDVDLDIASLRAEIARRYEGCGGERPDDRLPGEPAAAAPAGAGA